MKPNASICPSLGQFGGPARISLIALAAALPTLVVAAPPPALKLSPTLTAPAPGTAHEERALLRVEYQAAQMQASEADIVGDILVRVRHMDEMIREVRELMNAWPAASAAAVTVVPAAVAPTSPALPDATAAQVPEATPPSRPKPAPAPLNEEKPSPSGSLVLRALMASVIVFLFWLLGQRHRYLRAQRLKAAPAAPESSAAKL